jgi:hypothetical protein
MTTKLKLRPGQPGTKKLVAEHGDALVCVRYRYDAVKRKRFKTIELVIEESDWLPPMPKFRDDDKVFVQIGFTEKDLREAAKTAKGRWDPEARLWTIKYGNIKGSVLEKHIILDAFPKESKS